METGSICYDKRILDKTAMFSETCAKVIDLSKCIPKIYLRRASKELHVIYGLVRHVSNVYSNDFCIFKKWEHFEKPLHVKHKNAIVLSMK